MSQDKIAFGKEAIQLANKCGFKQQPKSMRVTCDLTQLGTFYQAATAEANKRIADLEIQNVLYKDDELEQKIAIEELQAANEALLVINDNSAKQIEELQARNTQLESEVAELSQINKELLDDQCEYMREVAELKAQKVRHDQLVDYLKCGIAEELEQRILELQASNNDLRDTVDMFVKDCEKEVMHSTNWLLQQGKKALASTPAESLQAHDYSDTERLNFLDRLQERATSDMKINMSLKSDIHINGSLGVSLYIRNYKGHTESTAYGKTIREAIDMALKEVK